MIPYKYRRFSGLLLWASLVCFLVFHTNLAACQTAPRQVQEAGLLAEIPFELVGEHLVVSLPVDDGQPNVDFVFDTGASATVLDSKVAATFAIKSDFKQSAMGAAGVQEYDISLNQTLTVNEYVKAKKIPFVLADLQRIENALGRPIAGITGCDLLRRYVVSIDYSQNKIRFFEQQSKIDVSGYTQAKLDFLNGSPLAHVEASIELENGDQFEGKLLLDTGAGLAISINSPFNRQNKMLDKAGSFYKASGKGLTTATHFNVVNLKSISIGEYRLHEMEMELSRATAGASAKKNVMGILGNQILKRFDLILDFKNRDLYLRPNHLFDTKFRFRLSGIGLIAKEGTLWIETIVPGSNADKSGLKIGEKLISVDGKQATELHTVRAWLQAEGETVEIVTEKKNGQLRKSQLLLAKLF